MLFLHPCATQAERGVVDRLGVPYAADPVRGVHRLLVQPSLRAMALLTSLPGCVWRGTVVVPL